MERQEWSSMVDVVKAVAAGHRLRRRRLTDETIAITWLLAVLLDRPMRWATDPWKRSFCMFIAPRPSASTFSRRLGLSSIVTLVERVWWRRPRQLYSETELIIDAKPLPVGSYTADRDARTARACGCFAWRTLRCTGGGLAPLPDFVRGQHRMPLLVGAQLLLNRTAAA